jgi:hypothetical protein
MGPNKLAHPSADQLAAFASGQAPQETAVELSRHLADCAACRTVVDALPDDTLLALLREQSQPGANQALHQAPTTPGTPATVPVHAVPPALAGHERYRVLGLLGAGGMGAVYKAEHRRMERTVALKVLSPNLMDRPAMVERFHREARAAALLVHPNIITAFDADQAGDTHFLVMEFVEGISLAQHVLQEGPLPVAEACAHVRQAALGLQHAFEHGMVHRDVKPHNLMLTPAAQVKILDFGLARLVREMTSAEANTTPALDGCGRPPGLTESGTIMGTADFIAPEQASAPSEADIRADIYSLGCTLYYLLVGHAPFPEGTALDKLTAHCEQAPVPLTALRRDVPPGVARVVERMMAKSPAGRYQTPAEVAEALAPFLAEARPRRRVGSLVAAAAIAVLGLIAAAVIYVQTDNGDFVIETEDDRVALMVNQKGLKVHDRAANREYLLTVGKHRLRSGEYEIIVSELPDGVELTTTRFALKRGGKTTAIARFRGKQETSFLKEEALRWFPADATFFGARDMRAFPDLSVQQLLVVANLVGRFDPDLKEPIWKFLPLVGRIDRISFAYQADPRPARSRIFIRATGSISHARLAEWFRQEWPGALLSEEKGAKGEAITLVTSSRHMAPAFALIGTTDLILAGYQGPDEKHLEVVRQLLELRSGHGAALPAGHVVALQDVPADAWMFLVGSPPEAFKMLPPFRILPRSMVMSVSGTRAIKARLLGDFATASEARAAVANLTSLREQGIAFINGPLRVMSGNARTATLLTKTLDGLRIEAQWKRVHAGIDVTAETLDTVAETVRDLPLSMFQRLLGALAPQRDEDRRRPPVTKR